MLAENLEQLIETYAIFNKHIRKIIAEEIKTGHYPHLVCPNTRGKYHDPLSFKARVNIIARNPTLSTSGQRTLNAGKTEAIFEIKAEFNDSRDLTYGFDIYDKIDWFRYVLGQKLTSPIIYNNIWQYIKTNLKGLKKDLHSGKYDPFVRTIVHAVDKSLEIYKG